MHKPILIIKTGSTIPQLKANGEDFEDWFLAGLAMPQKDLLVVSVYLENDLPTLSSIAGIIITGSAAMVTDEAPWNFVAAQYLRDAHDLEIPILGVCYGHQLVAWAFGGEVGFNSKGREIGSVDIELSQAAMEDPLFANLPKIFKANASHQQSVLSLPDSAELLAANDFDANHGFRLGSRTWGVQFHPEFSARVTRAYIEARSDEITEEGLDASQLLSGVIETPQSNLILSNFAAFVQKRKV